MGPKHRNSEHAWRTIHNLATLICRNQDTNFGPACDLMSKIAEVRENNPFVPQDKAEIELQKKVNKLHNVFSQLNTSIQNQKNITPQEWHNLQRVLEENP